MRKFLLLFAVLTMALGLRAEAVTDVLNNAAFGVAKPATGNSSYKDFTYTTSTSGTEYLAHLYEINDVLQFKGTSPSGFINTTSKGKATKVTITWNTSGNNITTANGRTLDIYGSNKPYTGIGNLYTTKDQGTKIGSLTYNTSGEATMSLDIPADKQYPYIGLRSAKSAQYAKSIEITWEVTGEVAIARPAFTPAAGIVDAGTVIKLTSATEGAKIYYTMGENPADPTAENGTLYTEAGITINDWTVIKAVAELDGKYSEVSTAEYNITPVIESLSYINEFPEDTPFYTAMPLTVVYVNGQNIYVYDGNSYGLLFNKTKDAAIAALTPGDVIKSGLKGNVTFFYGLPEFIVVSGFDIEAEKGDVPNPTPVSAEYASMLAMASANSYWMIEQVTFVEATPATETNFTGFAYDADYNEIELTFRNNFLTESVAAGNYDVVCFVGTYNGSVQYYPVEYHYIAPSIESLMSLPDIPTDLEFAFDGEAYVIYATENVAYITDGYSNAMLTGENLGLAAGDKLAAGWHAKTVDNHGLLQVEILSGLQVNGKVEAIKQPIPVEAADAAYLLGASNVNAYLKLMTVEIKEASPENGNFDAFMYTPEGETVSVTMRNEFGIPSVKAGFYDVTGFVGLYEETNLFYPIEMSPIITEIEDLGPIGDFEVGTIFKMVGKATTVYATEKAAYITAGGFNKLIASDEALGLETCDVVLPGWTGEVADLFGMTAIMATSALEVAEEKADSVKPVRIEPAEAAMMLAPYMANTYLTLEKVEIAAATSDKFTGTITPEGEDAEAVTVNFYNFFEIAAVEAGCYDVTGFVATIDGEVAFYPVAFVANTSGIASASAEEGATTYYNLQGVKVANPAAGRAYIRVCGGKAEKVIM